MQLGEANTRIRDYVDLYNLTGTHPAGLPARPAMRSWPPPLTAASACGHCSIAVGQLAPTRAGAYRTYRAGLGTDGTDLPDSLTEVITAVTAFADPLIQDVPRHRWNPTTRELDLSWTAGRPPRPRPTMARSRPLQ